MELITRLGLFGVEEEGRRVGGDFLVLANRRRSASRRRNPAGNLAVWPLEACGQGASGRVLKAKANAIVAVFEWGDIMPDGALRMTECK